MMIPQITLLCCCALAVVTTPGIATAKPLTKAAPTAQLRTVPPPVDTVGFRWFPIVRQDLFDRNNPNNARSDWPAPPAQPGQL
jgi:hypothetical protein